MATAKGRKQAPVKEPPSKRRAPVKEPGRKAPPAKAQSKAKAKAK
jgi:hypothetical protein